MPEISKRANNPAGAVEDSGLVLTGPGTLAGRYMRLFWQPVSRAMDLPVGRAKPIRIMSEDFTLYRGEGGAPHLLAFRCAHRGTQLSTGWAEGDNLRCFYHGWMYDGMGQCVEQPAEPEPFCGKIKIRSYPVEEYLGLIFAYLGEGEAPPLPRYPDFEDGGIRENSTYTRWCSYLNGLEDKVHLVTFAHGRWKSQIAAPAVSAEETEWGLTVQARRSNGELQVGQLGMPNIFRHLKKTRVDLGVGWRDDIHWRVPIDDEHHAAFSVEVVRAAGEAKRRYEERRAVHVEGQEESALAEAVLAGRLRIEAIEERPNLNISRVQDYVAQAGVGRIPDRSHEWLGRADVGVVLLRELWERELRALDQGRPLTKWVRSEGLVGLPPTNA